MWKNTINLIHALDKIKTKNKCIDKFNARTARILQMLITPIN